MHLLQDGDVGLFEVVCALIALEQMRSVFLGVYDVVVWFGGAFLAFGMALYCACVCGV